jgi:hypothetical protein
MLFPLVIIITMSQISNEKLINYRSKTFRWKSKERIITKEQGIQFVNQRGFIYFWPIKDILLPSLWVAVAGDRPVADAHDDPGHVTWGWKDSLLGAKRWYYGKILRKKATIISLTAAPYFYALSENFGSPEEDYLIQYLQGRMTQEAKAVYEALLNEGPLDTITLRREARLTSRESDSRFNRALNDLQADFKILPVGISQAGGWRYAYIYDLVIRHFPELLKQARHIQETEARGKLANLYLLSVGATRATDLVKLFRWSPRQVENTIQALVDSGSIIRELEQANQPGEWIAIPEVL